MAPPRRRPSNRHDLVYRTYAELRDRIVHGRLAPGARIIEAHVVERLGVSRTTVRAALQRLEHEGYVSSASGGGRFHAVVTALTRDDVRELFTIVGEVEGLAAAAAAEQPPAVRRSLAGRLRGINAEYRRAAALPAPLDDELFRLDTLFHRTYVEAGAGRRLTELHDAIKPQAERYIRYYQTVLPQAIRTSVAEHAAIVAAIRAGGARAAHRAVRTNWRNAAARLAGVIEVRGERGAW